MADTGEKIREYRKWKGLTQQQLADAANISVMSIRRYESGERVPTEKAIEEIAQALGISSELLDMRVSICVGYDVMIETEDGEIISASMNTREGKMLSRFQALNELGKDELIRQADILLEVDKFRRVTKEKPPQD